MMMMMMGVNSDPTAGNAKISPVLNNTVPYGSMSLPVSFEYSNTR